MTKRLFALLLALFLLGSCAAETVDLDSLMAEIDAEAETWKAQSFRVSAIQSYGYALAEITADQSKTRLAAAGLLVPSGRLTYHSVDTGSIWYVHMGTTPDNSRFQVIYFDLSGMVYKHPFRLQWTVGAETADFEEMDIKAGDYSSAVLDTPSAYWGKLSTCEGTALADEFARIRGQEDLIGEPDAEALYLGDLFVDAPEAGLYAICQRPVVGGGSRRYQPIGYELLNEADAVVDAVATDDQQARLAAPADGNYRFRVTLTDAFSGKQISALSRWLTLRAVALTPLSVSAAAFEISENQQHIFIDRPVISGGSGSITIAYNIYDADSNPVNYFYSDEARVAATPGYRGLFNVFIVVTDTVTGEQDIQNIGWNELLGPDDEPPVAEPLRVAAAVYEISENQQHIFIDRPVISGGSGSVLIAYNIYDADSNPVNYFYSDEARVAATPGYAGLFNVFIVVTDTVTGESDTQNIGWHQLEAAEEPDDPTGNTVVNGIVYGWYEDEETGERAYAALDCVEGLTTLVFVDEVNGQPVTLIAPGAFGLFNDNAREIQSGLTLPKHLKVIGSSAFDRCGITGKVVFPEGLEVIGSGAFYSTSVSSLVFPDSLQEIGGSAFQQCTALKGELRLPEGLEVIGGSAFAQCKSLTGSLVIPDGVAEIGERAFQDCAGLNGTLRLTGGALTAVGDYAFCGCAGLTGDLTIPEGVVSVGQWAFRQCGFDGGLSLPSTLKEIGSWAFFSDKALHGALSLPSGLQKIGQNAFEECVGLTGALRIPDSVTDMGAYAFARCTGLNGGLTLSAGMTRVPDSAFEGCSGLTGRLVIPSAVTTVGSCAFRNCSGFSGDLSMGVNVTGIGDSAFENCRGLTGTVYFSADHWLGNRAFEGTGVTVVITQGSADLPSGKAIHVSPLTFAISEDQQSIYIDRPSVEGPAEYTIAYNIYDDRSNPVNYFYSLEERVAATPGYGGLFNVFVVVTDTATGEQNTQNIGWQTICWPLGEQLTVGKASFSVSPDRRSIYVDRPEITCKSGQVSIAYNIYDSNSRPVNYFYSTEKHVAATPGYDGKFNVFIVVTDTVTGEQDIQNIGWQMLGDEVVTPNPDETWPVTIEGVTYDLVNQHVTVTGAETGLTTLHIADRVYGHPVTAIKAGAFRNHRFTGSLTIPDTVTTIGEEAFCNAGFDGTLTLPNQLRAIGGYAFFNTGFTGMLTIPDSVLTAGASAFAGCTRLTGVKFGASMETIAGGLLYGCTGLTGSLVIPDGVKRIDANAFYHCAGLTGDVIIPDSVTWLGDYAFDGCTGLNGSVVIGNGVTYIGQYAFRDCTGLTGTLTLGDHVEQIGEKAFCELNFTGDLTIPASVKSIQSSAFSGCRKLNGTLTVLGGLDHRYGNIFSICTGVKRLVLGEGLTCIPSSAFTRCASIGEVRIPSTVTDIGNAAFAECASLARVYVPQGCSIHREAFMSTNAEIIYY